MDVSMAAKPTKEWNAATVCGNAMGETRAPTTRPKDPPTDTSNASCAASSTLGKPRNAAIIAQTTPTMPNLQPRLAVFMVAKHEMEAMQRHAETVDATWLVSGCIKDQHANKTGKC